MRRKPIEKSKFYGCLTCGTAPKVVLDENKVFHLDGIYILNLTIDDVSIDIDAEEIALAEINEQVKGNCQFAELKHLTPLHDETYEYNTEDGKWYLVDQGQGYA